MDSNGLMSLNRAKNDAPVAEEGIRLSQAEEEIKRSQTMSAAGNLHEIPGLPVEEKKGAKKEKKEDVDRKNRKLSEAAKNSLGGIKEYEIKLDLDEEELQKLDLDLSRISDMSDRSLNAGENRLQKLGHIPDTTKKKPIKASESLRAVGNRVVKNGAFSDDAIRAGVEFMNKVDKWAGRSEDPSQTERDFYNACGSADTISFLYVDGEPIKEFVEKKYGYRGSDNKVKEKGVLSAYAAMITYRQNHAITLMRPTYIDGHADVEIRNLSVDMREFTTSRSSRVKVARNAFRGEDYRKYCETAYRTEMRAKSAKAALQAENMDNIEALDTLTQLDKQLKAAGKGTHRNYDDFVWAFHKYYEAVTGLASDPEDLDINRVTLEALDRLNTTAASAATDYLKGKKMNLPRHKAVESIRSYLNAQSGQFGKYLREFAKDETGTRTVSLSDLLAKEDAGFVVMGIEEEIKNYEKKAENDENDLNQYVVLDNDIGLSITQKRLLLLKNQISSDEVAKAARDALVKAQNNPDFEDQDLMNHARTFLESAASALLKNEEFLRMMKQNYPYAADNTNMMLAIIARSQLTRIYSDEFKRIPALEAAMEIWNEQISSEEASAMTYQNNFVGNRISKKDFDENGGSSYKRYVTRMEANEIVAATDGFLSYKSVEGRPDIVQLVPSMPEFTTLYKGQASEKRIPLRKTIKTVFKTLTRLATDENGHVKAEIGKYNDQNITYCIDKMLRTSGEDRHPLVEAESFLFEVVHAEMTRMFEEEYRQKNIWGYKNKAYNDAIDVCNNFLELIKGGTASFLTRDPDVSFDAFIHTVKVVNSVTTEDIMSHKKFSEYKIDGRTLTAEEVSEALEDFKAEMQENEAEFVKFRDLDTDDVEMPSVTSCNANANFIEVAKTCFVNNSGANARLTYELKHFVKTNPDGAIDALLNNLDNILDSQYENELTIKNHRERILELDEMRKKGALSKKDRDDLQLLYTTYIKYDWHRGANVGKIGNAYYTTETMASTPDHLIQSPFTNKILIGKYISDKPVKVDEITGYEHEAMNNYYDRDDPFVHCRERKQISRIAVKEIIRLMVDKYM